MERLDNTKKMVRLEIQQQLARYASCVRGTGASEAVKEREPVRYVNNIKYEKEARDALLRCIVSSLNDVAEAADAEARLISAAPELLQALEEVVSVIEDYCDDHNSDRPTDVTVALPRLREAITKAKGGE